MTSFDETQSNGLSSEKHSGGTRLDFHRQEGQKVKVGREMGWRTKVGLLVANKECMFVVTFIQ